MTADANTQRNEIVEEAVLAKLWLMALGEKSQKMPEAFRKKLLKLAHQYAATRMMDDSCQNAGDH